MNEHDQEETDFGKHVIWRLIGSTITAFGGNEHGEIFLRTEKDGKADEFIVGKDENGEISLFEIEDKAQG